MARSVLASYSYNKTNEIH